MRIKVRKKRLLLVSLLILVLIILSTLFTVYLRKTSSSYKRLLTHCEEIGSDGNVIQECKVFINDFYSGSEGEVCMNIILPELDASERNVEICLDKDKVQWDNPYEEDYISYNIPIIMEIDFPDSLINRFSPNNIYIKTMSDSDAQDLVATINSKAEQLIPYLTEASYEKIKKGYYLNNASCLDDINDICTVIGIYDVEIVDYYTDSENYEDAEIIFTVKMSLEDTEIEEEIRAKEFQYLEYDYGSREAKVRELLNSNSYLVDYIDDSKSYQIRCFIDGYKEFSEELIDDYINDKVELDFILIDLLYDNK